MNKALFLLEPAVLAAIHETMRGLAEKTKATASERAISHDATREERRKESSVSAGPESQPPLNRVARWRSAARTEVVADEKTSLVGGVVRKSVQKSSTNNDRNHHCRVPKSVSDQIGGRTQDSVLIEKMRDLVLNL